MGKTTRAQRQVWTDCGGHGRLDLQAVVSPELPCYMEGYRVLHKLEALLSGATLEPRLPQDSQLETLNSTRFWASSNRKPGHGWRVTVALAYTLPGIGYISFYCGDLHDVYGRCDSTGGMVAYRGGGRSVGLLAHLSTDQGAESREH